jgi:hypothetical protein
MGKKGEDAVTAAVRVSLICSTFIAAAVSEHYSKLVLDLSVPTSPKVSRNFSDSVAPATRQSLIGTSEDDPRAKIEVRDAERVP